MRVLSIEAIDQATQHCNDACEHLLAGTNTIGGNQSFSDRCIEASGAFYAEPRASSKNLARWRPCRLPFPSAVLRSMDRLARSSCSINSRRCRPTDFEASSRKAAIQATKPSSTVRRNKHRVFRGQKGDPLNIQKRFIIMYVNRVFRLFFFRCQLS